MAEDDRCSRAMGCDGVKCIWDAHGKGCSRWCKAHAQKWVPSVIKALHCAVDGKMPAMFTVDKLLFENKNGAFLRGDRCTDTLRRLMREASSEDPSALEGDVAETLKLLSSGRLVVQNAKVTVCGLCGKPPLELVTEWNNQFSHADLLQFVSYKGFSKKVTSVDKISLINGSNADYMVRMPDGRTGYVKEDRAAGILENALADPCMDGTRLIFEFKFAIGDIPPQEMVGICRSFDDKDPSGCDVYKSISGSAGRTHIIEPKVCGGGARFYLDCGEFVAGWHTMASLAFSTFANGSATGDLVMLW